MSWSTTTVLKTRSAGFLLFAGIMAALVLPRPSAAQDLRVPQSVSAGSAATISTTGNGSATFYLLGPGSVFKKDVHLGDAIPLARTDLKYAGRYLAILCSGTCNSAAFFVTAAQPASVAFLVHPSRVPVRQPDAVSGVALLFDRFGNYVLAPSTIHFQVNGEKEELLSRSVPTHDGEAWFRTSSGKAAGPVRLTASIGDLSAERVLQQVASDPCNLRITAQQTPKGLEVQTEPVRDCSGNPVSDGTVVTFTGSDASGKISIDAPIKGDIARARITVPEPVVISAACGVAMGNELPIGEKP